MDTATLILAGVVASIVMTATMLVMHRASPRETCLLDWAGAGALFLATNLISLAATQQPVPFWLAPALANAFYLAGHAALLAGVRRHLGLAPGWPWLAAMFALIAAVHALPFVQASVANRLLTFYPMIMALNLAVVALLWRAPPSDMKPAYWPLLLIEAFFFVQLLVRLWFVLAYDQLTLTFLGSQFAQTSGSLAILLFLSVATMACALIVIRHQELAMRRMSRTDGLTGWLNRHALQEMARGEERRAAPWGQACILFDIDRFKAINDGHGHAVGDTALRHVSTLAAGSLRGHDARFRIGGEEFAVLISDADAARVKSIAERLRQAVENHPLALDEGALRITISVGVAMRRDAGERWEDLLRRADQALYRSKEGGRNRVTMGDAGVRPVAGDPGVAQAV